MKITNTSEVISVKVTNKVAQYTLTDVKTLIQKDMEEHGYEVDLSQIELETDYMTIGSEDFGITHTKSFFVGATVKLGGVK